MIVHLGVLFHNCAYAYNNSENERDQNRRIYRKPFHSFSLDNSICSRFLTMICCLALHHRSQYLERSEEENTSCTFKPFSHSLSICACACACLCFIESAHPEKRNKLTKKKKRTKRVQNKIYYAASFSRFLLFYLIMYIYASFPLLAFLNTICFFAPLLPYSLPVDLSICIHELRQCSFSIPIRAVVLISIARACCTYKCLVCCLNLFLSFYFASYFNHSTLFRYFTWHCNDRTTGENVCTI